MAGLYKKIIIPTCIMVLIAALSFMFDKRDIAAPASLTEARNSIITPTVNENVENVDKIAGGNNPEVVKDPWLNGYPYRKEITLTNSTSTLTNYQVQLSVDTSTLVGNSKLQSDCDDLRFTTADGYTLMDYWIESGCNTATTKIWTEVPSIANSTSTIYMYYGNASSTAASSGSNTFLFFDDFPGSTLDTNKWNKWTAGTGAVTVGSGYARLYGSSGNANKSRLYSLTTFGNNTSMRYRYYMEASYTSYIHITNGTSAAEYPSTTGVYEIGGQRTYHASYSSYFSVYSNGTSLYGVAVTKPSGATWYLEELKLGSGYQQVTRNDSNLANTSQTMSSQSYRCWFGQSPAYNAAMGLRVDWVAVRNYNSTEPTTSVGSEVQLITQAGTGATNWTWKTPAAGDYVKNGTSTNWTWTAWQDDSAGLIVPYSTSTDWTWYPQ